MKVIDCTDRPLKYAVDENCPKCRGVGRITMTVEGKCPIKPVVYSGRPCPCTSFPPENRWLAAEITEWAKGELDRRGAQRGGISIKPYESPEGEVVS